MGRSSKRRILAYTGFVIAAAAAASAWAKGPCDLVTRAEATKLLGVAGGRKTTQHDASEMRCVVQTAGGDTLKWGLSMTKGIVREHMDEERGDAIPTNHGEPWYEVSLADPGHPEDRVLVIHRDHAKLKLQIHSAHQPDVQRAFESLWYQIADRLPQDRQK